MWRWHLRNTRDVIKFNCHFLEVCKYHRFMIWECNILRYQKVQIIEFLYFQLYTENGSIANKYQLLDSMDVSCLLGYTFRWCMASVECCTPSVPLCDAGASHAPLCRYSRKSITIVSVQGAPSGASLPAIHPRWPPLGVTMSRQFGFSCDSKPCTCLKGDGQNDWMHNESKNI